MEQVLQTAQEAMKASNELKSTIDGIKKKADAFDTEKLDKLSTTVNSGIEESQKLRQSVEGEKAAREQMSKQLEDQLKAMTDAGMDATKRLGTVEAALERISLNGGDDQTEAKALEKHWRKATDEFLRKRNSNRADFTDHVIGAEEFKDLTVGNNPDGGYMVMPVMGAMVTKRVWETSPMRSLASTMTISSNSIDVPLDNDEAATGGWVGEKTARTGTDTPELGEQKITVYEQYAMPKASQKLLDDAAFNAEAWLQKKVADKFSRVENTAFVAGAGVKSPRGFLCYPNKAEDVDFQKGTIEQILSGTDGGFDYDALVKAQNALKDPYQPNAKWLMQRSTNISVLTIKDQMGRPIFNMNYSNNAGIAANILGKDVVFAADMPAVATGSFALAYGDFEEGYQIVDRIGIRILRGPYTAKPFILFYTTKRVGGDVTNFEAIKLLKLSAS